VFRIETALLNIVNFQTLIATKAARIRSVIEDEPLMEFGTRRAQEMDAAIWGTQDRNAKEFPCSHITSTIGATNHSCACSPDSSIHFLRTTCHAHALVQVYGNDYKAFKAYASTHRDCVFLVDTYDTLRIGVLGNIGYIP